jgi:NADH-ubiquinone/plastoquinone oxidoreductase chain 6
MQKFNSMLKTLYGHNSFPTKPILASVTALGLLLRQRLGAGLNYCYAATDMGSSEAAQEAVAIVVPPETSPEHWGFSKDPSSFAYCDGSELTDMEVLGNGWDQFLLLHQSFGPGHWGPTDWGWLLGAGYAALVLSFGALLSSTRPVEAIFSFLALLLSLLLPFFCLEAEYVAAIHLMVYPGAILIFFSFATLTTDQRGHWDQ